MIWTCAFFTVGGGPQDCAEETIDKHDKSVSGFVGLCFCGTDVCEDSLPG